jgi:hypothetical protein
LVAAAVAVPLFTSQGLGGEGIVNGKCVQQEKRERGGM